MIDYAIACKLRDGLLEHHCLSDVHSVPSVDVALRVCHDAGLGTAFIPLAQITRHRSNAQYHMHLAVVDADCAHVNNRLVLNSDKDKSPTHVYALTRLVPLHEYTGSLVEMDLSRLWWAAPSFFQDLSQALAAWSCDNNYGRSHWGEQNRDAFRDAFDQQWHPGHTVLPAIGIPPLKVRFDYIPVLAGQAQPVNTAIAA